jgi:hypothetical protein
VHSYNKVKMHFLSDLILPRPVPAVLDGQFALKQRFRSNLTIATHSGFQSSFADLEMRSPLGIASFQESEFALHPLVWMIGWVQPCVVCGGLPCFFNPMTFFYQKRDRDTSFSSGLEQAAKKVSAPLDETARGTSDAAHQSTETTSTTSTTSATEQTTQHATKSTASSSKETAEHAPEASTTSTAHQPSQHIANSTATSAKQSA